MKKLIALVLALVCVLGLVGCNNDNQQEQEDKAANTHTLKVTENSVGEIGRETFNLSVEITEEDANALSEIINGSTWKEELTDCESDCVINLKGHWSHYNSESGILNKYNVKDMSVYSSKVQEVSGKSLVLSEEDRATVNNQRATVRTATQAEARTIARDLAIKNKSEMVVHGTDGRIREKNSYGNDPCPPKG